MSKEDNNPFEALFTLDSDHDNDDDDDVNNDVEALNGEIEFQPLESSERSESCDRREEEKLSYFDKLKLGFGVILMLFDNASDVSILAALYARGLVSLCIVGVVIDLIPGPVAAFYMAWKGYGLKSLTLMFHPINGATQFILAFCRSTEEKCKGHRQILLLCKELQGLLESPLQVVFTTVLVIRGQRWARLLGEHHAYEKKLH